MVHKSNDPVGLDIYGKGCTHVTAKWSFVCIIARIPVCSSIAENSQCPVVIRNSPPGDMCIETKIA